MVSIALSTGSVYTYGTARAFELAGRAGFDGVEVIVDDRWDTRQPEYLRRLIEQYGVPVLSVHSPFANLRLPGWPKREIDRIKQALALTEALGARVLNLHVPFRVRVLEVAPPGRRRMRIPILGASPDQRAYAAWLTGGGLAELQAQTSVTITVENLPYRKVWWGKYSPYALNSWDELLQFPRLCLDTTHTANGGFDLLAVYERLAANVAHVHLSDHNGTYQHQPLGKGNVALVPFLHALVRHRYDGIVVVELTPEGLPVQDEERLLVELRRNRDLCREQLDVSAEEKPMATASAAALA